MEGDNADSQEGSSMINENKFTETEENGKRYFEVVAGTLPEGLLVEKTFPKLQPAQPGRRQPRYVSPDTGRTEAIVIGKVSLGEVFKKRPANFDYGKTYDEQLVDMQKVYLEEFN